MIINYNEKIIQVKLVFFGPEKSGKMTILNYLCKKFNKKEESQSRTLFFDLGSLSLKGTDWNIKCLIYSATGRDFYASTRPSTLMGADGIIFVIDSNLDLLDHNIQSWNELKSYFKEFNKVPIVISLNKQDTPNPIDEGSIRMEINLKENENISIIKTIAPKGDGVMQCFNNILGLIFKSIPISF